MSALCSAVVRKANQILGIIRKGIKIRSCQSVLMYILCGLCLQAWAVLVPPPEGCQWESEGVHKPMGGLGRGCWLSALPISTTKCTFGLGAFRMDIRRGLVCSPCSHTPPRASAADPVTNWWSWPLGDDSLSQQDRHWDTTKFIKIGRESQIRVLRREVEMGS